MSLNPCRIHLETLANASDFVNDNLKGQRSSRLGLQYRVIYQIQDDQVLVLVIDINAHAYRSK
jgi:mRNA-degrading endonuclease RelE of RelBE toxin-antitoxin system